MVPPYLRTLRRELLRARPQLTALIQACEDPERPPAQTLEAALDLVQRLQAAIRDAISAALTSRSHP
jgi:hypothetical protein